MKLLIAGLFAGLLIGAAGGYFGRSALESKGYQPNESGLVGVTERHTTPSASGARDSNTPPLNSTETSSTVLQEPVNASTENGSVTSLSESQQANVEEPDLTLSDFNFNNRMPHFSEMHHFFNRVSKATVSELEMLIREHSQTPPSYNGMDTVPVPLLFSRLYELDADVSLNLLSSLFSESMQPETVYQYADVIKLLAETHSDELLAMLDTMPGDQYGLSSQVYAGMARVDPERAIQLAQQENNNGRYGGDRREYEVLHEWAMINPQAAMEWATSQSDPQAQNDYISMVFSQWAHVDYEQAAQFLQTVNDPSIRQELQMSLIYASAQHDPVGAIDYAMTLSDEQLRMSALDSALRTWGNINPQEAIDFVTYNLSGEEQAMGFGALGTTISVEHFVGGGSSALEALDKIQALPDGLRQPLQMQTLERNFYEDPAGSLAYIESLADENERQQLLSVVAYGIPEVDLPLALDLFQRTDIQTRQMLISGIAQQLYNQSPAQAMDWVDTLNADERDPALFTIIERMSYENPDEAMRFVNEFANGVDTMLAESLFYSMLPVNPEKAREWLEQANIDENLRNELSQALQQMPDVPYGLPYRMEGY